ncbi:MAG TPA: dynamin family protein [Thermoanaerobaculia bacterium]
MADLNESQRRHLLATLRYADRVIADAAARLAAGASPGPFQELVPDASPVQAKVTEDSLARFREALVQALALYGIAPSRPTVGAVWSARTALLSAEIALEDLVPRRMRGYGELSAAAAAALDGTVAELKTLVQRMARYLARGPARDLPARLDRLGGAGFDLDLLRRLEQVVTAEGLIELRPALGLLVERLESPTFEIAVFGRVSSGKSSLLNHLLRRDLLPVGVTPVTAVPVRIVYDREPGILVAFADRASEGVALDRLAELATEEQNPGNAKHVASIQVRIDEPRLAEGVTLVDTPGLGSLATRGAAETLAYLPRCDLGLVMIDAAAALQHEDLAVIDALAAAGARVMVLLSKADLLGPGDRERVLRYVRQQIREGCGFEVAVELVSVVGEQAGLADRWFDREVLPLVHDHREQALASLGRKLAALREEVVAVLESRRDRPPGVEVAPLAGPGGPLDEALRRAAAVLQGAPRRCEVTRGDPRQAMDALMAEAARRIALRWPADHFRADLPAEVLTDLAVAYAAELAARQAACLAEVRQELGEALALAEETGAPSEEALPPARGMPALDPGQVAPGLVLARPAAAWLGRAYLSGRVLAAFRRQAGAGLASALATYRQLLTRWSQGSLASLREAFEAQEEVLRARRSRRAGGGSGSGGDGAEDRARIDEALALLARGPGTGPGHQDEKED